MRIIIFKIHISLGQKELLRDNYKTFKNNAGLDSHLWLLISF
jgi:hypothetical protein